MKMCVRKKTLVAKNNSEVFSHNLHLHILRINCPVFQYIPVLIPSLITFNNKFLKFLLSIYSSSSKKISNIDRVKLDATLITSHTIDIPHPPPPPIITDMRNE